MVLVDPGGAFFRQRAVAHTPRYRDSRLAEELPEDVPAVECRVLDRDAIQHHRPAAEGDGAAHDHAVPTQFAREMERLRRARVAGGRLVDHLHVANGGRP